MSAAKMKLAHSVSGPAEVSKHMIFDPSAEVSASHQTTAAAHGAEGAAEDLLSSLAQSEVPREQMLAEIFDVFDADATGALDHTQFQRFFRLLNAEVSLSEAEWVEICESLGVEAAVGISRGADQFDQFFEAMDSANMRSIYSSVVPQRSPAAGGGGSVAVGGGTAVARESEEEKMARLLASRAQRSSSTCSPGM